MHVVGATTAGFAGAGVGVGVGVGIDVGAGGVGSATADEIRHSDRTTTRNPRRGIVG